MKILFLTNDMRIKHFHMACALRSNLDVEIHLLHIWPTRRLTRGPTAHFVKDAEESGIFDSVQRYSPKRFAEICADVTYVNDLNGISRAISPLARNWRDLKIVCDIEDCAAIDVDVLKSLEPLVRERELVSNPFVDLFLFGSVDEQLRVRLDATLSVASRVQYPFVAQSTLPKTCVDKTEEFSVVYAGSIWGGGGYRDLFPLIEQFGKCKIKLDVYMLNDWTHHWKRLVAIHKKYPSVRAFPRLKLFEVKQEIQKYHAGLCIGGDFNKVRATFGMKPLEYAYAGVVPFSVITSGKEKRVRNLSNGRVFGYTTLVSRVEKDFVNLLHNFDWNYHSMDSHLYEFTELMS